MIDVVEHAELGGLNTFRLPGRARFLATVRSVAELQALLADPRYAGFPRRVLGGGSNIVLDGSEIDALVIRVAIGGWQVLADDGSRVVVTAGAGMAWHDLVTACVEAGYGGIENLALIPGTVGAAPVQNIGAYGVELATVLDSVEAIDLCDGTLRTFTRAECRFGYRDSVFKHEASTHAITGVRLVLDRNAPPDTGYRDLRDELAARGNPPVDRRLVYDMVCAIRRRKLPDPAHTGNAGSFFKNPVVDAALFAVLQQRCPGIVGYPQADGRVKLAAGWLIDQAGWKGRSEGDAAVHARQALVLVNLGAATGAQVLQLARRIRDDVQARYGVTLEMEPPVWGRADLGRG